ncbi:hypothetical protein GQ457_18G011990 [Hibiscus cannabinus]
MSSAEVESEYESEPDGSDLLRRRTEATDDDKELEEEENKMAALVRPNASLWGTDNDDESEYFDDYVDDEASYVDELEKLAEQVAEESKEKVDEHVMATKQRGKEKVIDADKDASTVPRFGAFYMHDDRHSTRNQRRNKSIWVPKDELKWMHDKFEEMTLEETRNKELSAFQVPSTSNYYHQGRNNKNNANRGGYKAKESRLHYKYGNDDGSSKIVKGRGPVRYKPLSRSISMNPPLKSMQLKKTQGADSKTTSAREFSANNKQHYKRSLGRTENANSGRALSTKGKRPVDTAMASHADPASLSFHGSNTDCDSLSPHQHLLAPSISSYQQEFYPTSSFHLDIPCARPIGSEVESLQIGSNSTSSRKYTGKQGGQHLNAPPRLFPVQFGALHRGILGNPAVDMTSTGYNGESQIHLRNPDLARYATRTSIPNNEGGTSGPSDSHHLPSPKTS